MVFIHYLLLNSPQYEMCDLLVLISMSLVKNDWSIFLYAYWLFLFPLLWTDTYLTHFSTLGDTEVSLTWKDFNFQYWWNYNCFQTLELSSEKLWSLRERSMRWALQQKLICRYQRRRILWIPICCLFHICSYSPPVDRLCLVNRSFCFDVIRFVYVDFCSLIFCISFRRPPLPTKL